MVTKDMGGAEGVLLDEYLQNVFIGAWSVFGAPFEVYPWRLVSGEWKVLQVNK